jgi:Flp pilus assembly protein TadD
VALQFERAVRIAPAFARGWNNLGVAQVRLGQQADAQQSYRRALELQPSFSSARRNLGNLDAPEGPDTPELTRQPARLPAEGAPAAAER